MSLIAAPNLFWNLTNTKNAIIANFMHYGETRMEILRVTNTKRQRQRGNAATRQRGNEATPALLFPLEYIVSLQNGLGPIYKHHHVTIDQRWSLTLDVDRP